jgi:hypothetical protein
VNGRETQEAERALENERRVHLVDAEAVRRALLGDPGALTELERGAVVSICDSNGFDRELTAAGLGVSRKHLEKLIKRRRMLAGFAYRAALAAGAREPAEELVDAVRDRHILAVAEVLTELDTQGLYALAIVLADMVARDPDADDAPLDPEGL